MKRISVGLIGFGTVGSGVVKILRENGELLRRRIGFPIELRRIADLDIETDRGVPVERSILTTDAHAVLEDPEIDVVVELIGGREPARTFILSAIQSGKQVVTANKALLADHGSEIFEAARAAGVHICFEASVAGGIPILKALREGLLANRFEKILAILNGTCNFILTAMNENPGAPFDETLREAQRLGYAEADPSLDIDGTDTAHKLVLVLGLTHGIRAATKDLYVQGLRGIDPFDVLMAREFSYKIKLLAVATDHGDRVEARVHPTMLPETHPLANVDGVFNGIFLKGDMVGEQLFYGRGAGREPTASAVVADIVEAGRNLMSGRGCEVPPLGYAEASGSSARVMDMADVMTNYYLRVQALDKPGVLSKIAGIMADYQISIHSVVQKQRKNGGAVPVVFLTHLAREADVQQACRQIGELSVVQEAPIVFRIEDESLA
ncbi:MAG: homoserine dehydrogenase [Desulfomonilaceae bacterium]